MGLVDAEFVEFGVSWCDHISRMALMMLFRAADQAGRNPPRAPMAAAKRRPYPLAKGPTSEFEGGVAEGLKVAYAGGEAVDGECEEDAEDAADEGEADGFQQKGCEDGGAGEAEGAEGADFFGAAGDGGVHGVGGGEGAADGHDDGDAEAEVFQSLGGWGFGEIGVIVFFEHGVGFGGAGRR